MESSIIRGGRFTVYNYFLSYHAEGLLTVVADSIYNGLMVSELGSVDNELA